MEIEFESLFGFNMVSVISIICMILLAALFILCVFALFKELSKSNKKERDVSAILVLIAATLVSFLLIATNVCSDNISIIERKNVTDDKDWKIISNSRQGKGSSVYTTTMLGNISTGQHYYVDSDNAFKYNNCFDSSVYLIKQKEIINLFIIKFSKTSQLVDVVCSGEEKYEEK